MRAVSLFGYVLLAAAAVGLLVLHSFVSPAALALGGAAVAGVAVRLAADERLVTARHPEYTRYAASTKRLVPWVVTLALCVGCRSRSGAASLGEVPVVAPFAAMNLPIGHGVVWQCNVARMKVVYDGGDKAALGDAYERALAGRGWAPVQTGALTSTQWLERLRKGHEQLTLDVHDADFRGKVPGGVEVFLSIEDVAP